MLVFKPPRDDSDVLSKYDCEFLGVWCIDMGPMDLAGMYRNDETHTRWCSSLLRLIEDLDLIEIEIELLWRSTEHFPLLVI